MKPIIHRYEEINVGKYKSVKHFKLTSYEGEAVLSNLINISRDRQFAKSTPIYWVKTHNGKKWSSSITGLFKIPNHKNAFLGDLRGKRDLIIVKLLEKENGSQMIIYVYRNHYPFNKFLHPTQLGLEVSEKMNKKKASIRG